MKQLRAEQRAFRLEIREAEDTEHMIALVAQR
jgi:hypothetical protein